MARGRETKQSKFNDRVRELRRVRAGDLLDNPKNWRTHPERQRTAFRELLERIGFATAILAREEDDGQLTVIDGHLRKEEVNASDLVPVLVIDVDEKEADLMLATIDPLAGLAKTDDAALKSLLEGMDFRVDEDWLKNTLGSVVNVDKLFPPVVTEVEVPEPPKVPVTKKGDLWLLGEHRLLCGDSTEPKDIDRLVGTEKVSVIHADPPYGMGKEKDGILNDNLYREKLDKFQMSWWQAWRTKVMDNGSVYIWGNAKDLWRLWYCGGLQDSERLSVRNEIVWDKSGGHGVGTESLRSFYLTERCLFLMLGEQTINVNADNYWEGWEPVRSYLDGERERLGWTSSDIERITGVGMATHWFTRSQWCFITREHYEKLQAAARDDAFRQEYDAFRQEYETIRQEYETIRQEFYTTRAYFDNAHDNMTDVWSFPRVFGEERYGHATPKPVQMVARVLKSSSQEGDVIGVPFAGTGPEFIAAEQLNRKCYAMEIDPTYCDVIIERWQNLTSKKATRG